MPGQSVTVPYSAAAEPAPAWHLPLPTQVTAVRHGQSTANAAFAEAALTGALSVPITDRDADLPLTHLGAAQAAAVGRRLACDPPQVVFCSPYLRTRQTLAGIAGALADTGAPAPVLRFDERLRDRETGAWEMLTTAALRRRYPEEMARRDHVGPFYFRPPGGENFPDVALRVRSLLRDALPAAAGRHLLIVAHDAVVLMLRMIFDGLDEPALNRIVDAGGAIGNCTVTRWTADGARLRLADYNDAVHLRHLAAVSG
ncbi:histidine phosphatase family protein [Actinocrinis puniceicyclus]|uniref:Histidine phosphatase family protein n=1 Tax=Actinocrinis puniceicyclus TaxID=977794 RepID=A0A8J7WUN1_9ACTN|nr:histidine phosphatase family protein [Actinocrinis puniceicyclus]MBS2966777.1 histidine phosphatase family protein [Actinocrinis puniceicyclus]